MDIVRAVSRGAWGIVAAVILNGCGGGGGGGSAKPSASVTVSVSPTTITLGQSATVTWSSNGTGCTASGAWSGSQSASGSTRVTPTAAGSQTYSLNCTGGAYSSGNGSATLTVNAASSFSLTNLSADTAGTAAQVDAHLTNPWGLSIPAGPFFAWVANNHSDSSTLYNGNGKAQPHAAPLVVTFPAGFDATGIAFNGSDTDFMISAAGKSAAARFIFVGEGGMIAGWSPDVAAGQAVVAYTDAGGARYTGLAIATQAGKQFLYAADLAHARIDVFDSGFVKQTASGSAFTFADPSIPAGYGPFGIQTLKTGTNGALQIYVTYAKQNTNPGEPVRGAGLGYVDVYDTNGQLVKQRIAQGVLNAPWGVALAPADFGTLSGALLIGNFGDGKINGYDPGTGAIMGVLNDSTGAAIATPGLWGIAFGNDANNQPHNTLFFTAGTNDEANGVFGRIDLGGAPALNQPPVATLSVPTGPLKGTVVLSATATTPLAIAKVEFLAGATVIGSDTTAPYSISWDTTTVADGSVSLTARATDSDGNVGTSAATVVTVQNVAPPTVTLSQLQTDVFTPICSVCHNGNGSSLPGVQNLTAGHTFGNIVNVDSIEQPSLKRIKPGDPDNSYLIRKIEGAAGISGSRMPQGCGGSSSPCLDQATIDRIRSWVTQGALNN